MTEITASQKQEILNQIEVEIYTRSFYMFVQRACAVLEPQTAWNWNFHHAFICELLQAETHRIKANSPKEHDIIINVPFRSSKSLIVSILYPIWSWIIYPEMQFINLSYSANLSTDHSNKVVALINSPWFHNLFGWEFEEIHKSKTDFKLKRGSSRISGGVTGTVLGRGGDCIVLDDPNSTMKLSGVERHNTIKAWQDTISTRLNNPTVGLFIVIQQRLHQHDLSGYLLEKQAENWLKIVLPAELSDKVQPPHLAIEYQNNLLWQDRFSRKVLDNFKETLGAVGYANQLLQETAPPEGNIIKYEWLRTITLEKFMELCDIHKHRVVWDFFLDSAQTEAKKNDPTGIMVACKFQNSVYVRKVIEKRLSFPDLIRALERIFIDYGKPSSKVFIEPKSNGKDIIAQLRRQTNYNIVELPTPTTDKETRLNAIAPLIESSRYYLIEDISNEIITDQLTGFPNASHDEFCDLTGYALTRYIKKQQLNYLML